MRAAIDIGSNSIRLATTGGIKRSVITKLADGMEHTRSLSRAGVENTVTALKSFAKECADVGITDIFAFATEAVRRAEDGADFIARVKRETGLDVTLLSPEDEARYALKGAKKPSGAVTVCDLGGGSLEVVSSADGVNPDYIKSLPLGVVIIKNKYNGDYERAIAELPELMTGYAELPRRNVVVTGGSACTAAACMLNLKVYDAERVSSKFTARELDNAMPIFLSKHLTALRPIAERRADTLPYGAVIIQALINRLGASEFYVSDSSNLEAALSDR